MKPIRVFKIILRRRILAFSILFLLVATTLAWFSWGKETKRTLADIAISSDKQTVTFNSGYYAVDSFGLVYTKTGSPIENTDNSMYPYISYLSQAYITDGSQLDLTGKDIIVANGAVVLMEGTQTFNSLDVQTGGTITQPQPDRNGYINRYQYSDQEWGTIFYGFLKVANGEKRKLTCPANYYTDPTTNSGNGCLISYSPTIDGSVSVYDLDNWVDFDQIWQTASASFDVARYSEPGAVYIDNTSGSDQYYPIRFKFKNDNRDDRLEPMQAILRDDANAVVGSADGVDETLIYGISTSGAVDIGKSGEMYLGYYLAENYLPTTSSPELGWILEDFSNAYESYSAENINLATFFANGFGQKTNGIFYLEFDDRVSYSSTVAATPFSKGTSGNVFDVEVYKTFTASAKTLNSNIGNGPATRYIPAGLVIDVQNGEIKLSGGYIDVSGKGYSGYNLELRTETDDSSLLLNRGGGSSLVSNLSGGLSSNNIPQSAAHANSTGTGGGGIDKNSQAIAQNTNVYDARETASTLGSGGGGASQGAEIPSRGGNGGGYISLRAKILRFTSKTTGIKANGGNGYQISSGWEGSSGGSGGTIAIAAANVYYPTTDSSTYYFQSTGGVGALENANSFYSSGAGGGYTRLAFSSFYSNGQLITSKDIVRNTINIAGGQSGSNSALFGGIGQYIIDFSPISTLDFPDVGKSVSITRGSNQSSVLDYQILPTDTVNINLDVAGLSDSTSGTPLPADIVLALDTSGSMNDSVTANGVTKTKIAWLREATAQLLNKAAIINADNPGVINLGLVNFNSSIPLGHDPINCLVDTDNPVGTQCSNSYNADFMTTNSAVFVSEYIAAVNAYLPQGYTSAGAGINNAISHLSGNYARDGVRKYIIFVSDGMENMPPCLTGKTGGTYPYCNQSITNFNSTGKPESGYPIDRLKIGIDGESIGLISIGTTINSQDPYSDYLSRISEYTRPDHFKEKVYYNTEDISTIGEAFQNTIDSIVNSSVGMSFTVRETLPPGVELVGNLPIMKVYGSQSGEYVTPVKIIDPENRITLVWTITNNNYLPKTIQEFDSQHFVATVKYRSTYVPSGQFFDSDQNKSCLSSDPNDAIPFISGYNSFAQYQPVGNYIIADGSLNPIPFATFCHQYFSNYIQGDVSGLTDVLPNFSQLDKHLYHSSGTINSYSTAYYKISNYEFNPNAQAYWDSSDENRNQKMLETVARLKQNSKKLPHGVNVLAGIFDGICGYQSECSESLQYSDGRVWNTASRVLVTANQLKYKNKSTIIIDGNNSRKDLIIDTSILPVSANDQNSSIGFIVMNGDVIIRNFGSQKNINISVFAPKGDIIIQGNKIELTGSFVANDFTSTIGSNGIRFIQDTKLESSWPPGFRDLQPLSVQSK